MQYKQQIVIMNSVFAIQYCPDGKDRGQQITLHHGENGKPTAPKEIIRIVGGSRHESLATQPLPEFYIPASQDPSRRMDVVIRTTAHVSGGVQASLRNIVPEFDKDLFVPTLEPLEQHIGLTLAQPRFNMML